MATYQDFTRVNGEVWHNDGGEDFYFDQMSLAVGAREVVRYLQETRHKGERLSKRYPNLYQGLVNSEKPDIRSLVLKDKQNVDRATHARVRSACDRCERERAIRLENKRYAETVEPLLFAAAAVASPTKVTRIMAQELNLIWARLCRMKDDQP